MQQLNNLKNLTKILFIICMVTIAFVPGFVLLLFISPETVPFKIRNNEFDELNAGSITAIAVSFGGYCLFVYALYLFRKVLDLFSKRKIFDDLVILYLNRIGQFILGGLVLTVVPPHIYRLFTQSPINLSPNTGDLSFIFFTLSLGLFFMVLSGVFQMAKKMKEENDLTV